MNIRQALRRQSDLSSGKRGRETRRLRGSNVILAMMAGLLAVICAVEILQG